MKKTLVTIFLFPVFVMGCILYYLGNYHASLKRSRVYSIEFIILFHKPVAQKSPFAK